MINTRSVGRVALFVGLPLIAVGIAYYFFVTIPNRNLIKNQRDCLELSLKREVLDSQKWNDYAAKYAYINKLKTCVYQISYKGTVWHVASIEDLYAGKTLAICMTDIKTGKYESETACDQYYRMQADIDLN